MSRFVSESDIEANKRQLQEAWDATRKETDPVEAPEQPPPDNRPLYHRLEEQRVKKQEDYDDAHRLKNMIRGLEDEEVEFLDLVDRQRMEQERKLKLEEDSALSSFRQKQAEADEEILKKHVFGSMHPPTKKQRTVNSQKVLLAGAVRRKSDTSSPPKRTNNGTDKKSSQQTTSSRNDHQENSSANKAPVEEGRESNHTERKSDPPGEGDQPPGGGGSDRDPSKPINANGKNLQIAGYLPGLGSYSDSSENSDSSDLEGEDGSSKYPTDLLGRHLVQVQSNSGGGGGCC